MNEFSTQVEILEKSIKLGTPPQKKKKNCGKEIFEIENKKKTNTQKPKSRRDVPSSLWTQKYAAMLQVNLVL